MDVQYMVFDGYSSIICCFLNK